MHFIRGLVFELISFYHLLKYQVNKTVIIKTTFNKANP
jgi:hypothetical protein